jgi:predicted DNA-binding transcriptional regulator AlpA
MDGYYTVKDVCRKLNVSRETIYRYEKRQWFPKRVHFTCHARGRCGFPVAEVDAWDLANRKRRDVGPPAAL